MNTVIDCKIVIGICDDEKIYRDMTKKLCNQFIKNENIRADIIEFSSGEELLRCNYRIDILFLDIIMDDLDGIAIKEKFGSEDRKTIIIFQSSYINHMQKAFGAMVLGFLIKPIKENEFHLLMIKVLKKIKGKLKIEVDYNNEKYWIRTDDIIYIKSEDQYTVIVTAERTYLIRQKISYWEKILANYSFYRVHRCFIINLKYIKNIDGYKIIMNNQDMINISRNRNNQFKEKLHHFIKFNQL